MAFPWLINGCYETLTKWDDPPSSSWLRAGVFYQSLGMFPKSPHSEKISQATPVILSPQLTFHLKKLEGFRILSETEVSKNKNPDLLGYESAGIWEVTSPSFMDPLTEGQLWGWESCVWCFYFTGTWNMLEMIQSANNFFKSRVLLERCFEVLPT